MYDWIALSRSLIRCKRCFHFSCALSRSSTFQRKSDIYGNCDIYELMLPFAFARDTFPSSWKFYLMYQSYGQSEYVTCASVRVSRFPLKKFVSIETDQNWIMHLKNSKCIHLGFLSLRVRYFIHFLIFLYMSIVFLKFWDFFNFTGKDLGA